MKKLERVRKRIEADREIMRRVNNESFYTIEDFIKDIQTYIKAVKDGRILYTVISVARSGMSRDISILSCEKSRYNGDTQHYYRQYCMMLKVLGYRVNRGYRDTIKVNGCGMNMLFATNHSLIHKFCRLGFISKKQCGILAQKVN